MSEPACARPNPCPTCPYRRNVPSGIWDATEYAKLAYYDGDTWEQAPGYFACHQDDGSVCSGWLGHRDPADLLAVRIGVATEALDPSVLDYHTDVPLFATGAEAAAHGMTDYETPGTAARASAQKIVTARAARHHRDAERGGHDGYHGREADRVRM